MKKKKILKRVLMGLGVVLLIAAIVMGSFVMRMLDMMGTGGTVEAGTADDSAIVQTLSGQVRGYINDGIYTYHGIPYAQAEERFVPAEEMEPWEGVLDAAAYGPIAVQSGAGSYA